MGIVPGIDFTDPTWGVIDTQNFHIEFNMGSHDQVVCIGCHVRGVAGGAACVAQVASQLGVKALDSVTGDLLDPSNPELGVEQWVEYRDEFS